MQGYSEFVACAFIVVNLPSTSNFAMSQRTNTVSHLDEHVILDLILPFFTVVNICQWLPGLSCNHFAYFDKRNKITNKAWRKLAMYDFNSAIMDFHDITNDKEILITELYTDWSVVCDVIKAPYGTYDVTDMSKLLRMSKPQCFHYWLKKILIRQKSGKVKFVNKYWDCNWHIGGLLMQNINYLFLAVFDWSDETSILNFNNYIFQNYYLPKNFKTDECHCFVSGFNYYMGIELECQCKNYKNWNNHKDYKDIRPLIHLFSSFVNYINTSQHNNEFAYVNVPVTDKHTWSEWVCKILCFIVNGDPLWMPGLPTCEVFQEKVKDLKIMVINQQPFGVLVCKLFGLMQEIFEYNKQNRNDYSKDMVLADVIEIYECFTNEDFKKILQTNV